MKLQIGILIPDQKYVQRIRNFFIRHYAEKAEISGFADFDEFLKKIQEKRMDVILAAPKLWKEEYPVPQECAFAYLMPDFEAGEENGRRRIDMYQKADLLWQEIQKLYLEVRKYTVNREAEELPEGFFAEDASDSKTLICELGETDEIDAAALEMLRRNRIPGILVPSYEVQNGKRMLKYRVPFETSLKCLLGSVMEREYVLTILENICKTIGLCEEYFLEEEGFVLDERYLYADSNGKVELLYFPVQGFYGAKKQKAFFRKVLRDVIEDPSDDTVYLADLLFYLNAEEFLTLSGFLNQVRRLKYISRESNEIEAFDRTLYRETSEHINRVKKRQCEEEVCNELTDQEKTKYQSLVYDMSRFRITDKVMLLVSMDPENPGEFTVNKELYRIGRRSTNDAVIPALFTQVSRDHCYIVKEKEEYYLVDEKSAYGTMVDGEICPHGVRIPIGEGSVIDLAGVQFRVEMKKTQQE